MATLADYLRLVRLRGYDGMSDTQLTDVVNEARRRLVKDHRWQFLQSVNTALVTAPNVASVDLTPIADLAYIEAVRAGSGGVEIASQYQSYQEFRSLQVDAPNFGAPYVWTRRGLTTLLLYPTPDAVYTLSIDYYAKITALSTGQTDTIPDTLQDLVVWAAISTLVFRQRDYWDGGVAENQYQTLLRQAAGQENIQQRQSSQQVRSGYWGAPR